MNRTSLTVVTNNTEILILLFDSKINVISSGGFLNDNNRVCLMGGDAQRTFENIYADIAFFLTKGVTQDGIISDFSREEILVREAMMKNANKTCFLCDSSKFDTRATYKQCNLNEVDYFISEDDCTKRFSDYVKNIVLL